MQTPINRDPQPNHQQQRQHSRTRYHQERRQPHGFAFIHTPYLPHRATNHKRYSLPSRRRRGQQQLRPPSSPHYQRRLALLPSHPRARQSIPTIALIVTLLPQSTSTCFVQHQHQHHSPSCESFTFSPSLVMVMHSSPPNTTVSSNEDHHMSHHANVNATKGSRSISLFQTAPLLFSV